jgi:hypothetical protein
MVFFVQTKERASSKPIKPPRLPSVVLFQDNWNDYGYVTTFYVYYFSGDGEQHHIGETKILQRGTTSTTVPPQFDDLSDQYCSLGQDFDYYKRLKELGDSIASDVLRSLKDVVFEPHFGDSFHNTQGFSNSLLRFSEAEKVYKEGGELFGRVRVTHQGMSFIFSCKLEGFSERHVVQLDFTAPDSRPHRLLCFIGKNGTGKSGTLAKLATSLSGWELHAGTFEPGRPAFSRVVCVSYTVFQPFEVPFSSSTSYRYCGLRNESGSIDIDGIATRASLAIESIFSQQRTAIWLELLKISDLFGGNLPHAFGDADPAAISRELTKLSSGQRMVVSIFTELVGNIDNQSLVLLDEPETYLHPTLLSTFLRLLHSLLKTFDSYAIAATHSPIVVQEIPARSVRIFERQGTIPMQASLPIESLGANLTELSDTVFVMNDDDKNYKAVLRELADGRTLEELDQLFDGRLSLNAKAFLLSHKRRQG